MPTTQSTGRVRAHSKWNNVRLQDLVVEVFEGASSRAATALAHQRFPFIPLRTIQLWKSHYDKFGESPAATSAALGKRYSRRGRKSKIRIGHLRILKDIVEENPAWYLDEISDEFHRRNQDG